MASAKTSPGKEENLLSLNLFGLRKLYAGAGAADMAGEDEEASSGLHAAFGLSGASESALPSEVSGFAEWCAGV